MAHSMDVRNECEIYIPVEAEVKSIPLQSVPTAVRRRIVPSLSPADPSEAIWISPAVIRRKGQGPASRRGGAAAEDAASLLGAESRDGSDPLQISFVSSNPAARELLKGVSPGRNPSHTHPLPNDSTPPASQTAVVIYQGRLYLCIRGKGKPKAPEASLPAVPSTSLLSSKPTQKEVRHVRRPRTRPPPRNVKHQAKKRKDAPRPPDGERKARKAARGEPAPEEAALQPACVQPQEEQADVASCELGEEDAGFDAQTDSSDPWTMSADAASSSPHVEFDFSELAREEQIAQMKAKLMQSEAALKKAALQ
ncbi:uncharacterized protein PAE49_011550 [Odontesthes bonariensis]|uniref:uncharacterized protein LOC142390173 n=1 Tax=Odontesthes bonariensis TaxID=219752 RepID=UPI003F586E05